MTRYGLPGPVRTNPGHAPPNNHPPRCPCEACYGPGGHVRLNLSAGPLRGGNGGGAVLGWGGTSINSSIFINALRAWSDGGPMSDPQGGLIYPTFVLQGSVPARIIAPRKGKMRRMYARVQVQPNQPSGPNTTTFTLFVDGQPTALIAVVAGVETAGSDLVNKVAILTPGSELEVIVGFNGDPPESCRVEAEFV